MTQKIELILVIINYKLIYLLVPLQEQHITSKLDFQHP